MVSLFRRVPGLQALRSYRRQWLAKDIVAGVVLTTLLVPQGMAYAELAGLPPITGLYTSIMCLLGYAAFGPSRILVLGPDSSLGPMIAATILPLMAAGGDEERAVALASALALMVAAIMIVSAVAKLGFIADLISKPTMIGYMNGLALTILVGQLPKLFGVEKASGASSSRSSSRAPSRDTNRATVVVGSVSWRSCGPATLAACRPGSLVAVLVGIAAVSLFGLGRGAWRSSARSSQEPPTWVCRMAEASRDYVMP